MYGKRELAIVSDLIFISGTNFVLSRVEHEKKFYNLEARPKDVHKLIRVEVSLLTASVTMN